MRLAEVSGVAVESAAAAWVRGRRRAADSSSRATSGRSLDDPAVDCMLNRIMLSVDQEASACCWLCECSGVQQRRRLRAVSGAAAAKDANSRQPPQQQATTAARLHSSERAAGESAHQLSRDAHRSQPAAIAVASHLRSSSSRLPKGRRAACEPRSFMSSVSKRRGTSRVAGVQVSHMKKS